jgi:uncharacterized protein (TIGR02594 family)
MLWARGELGVHETPGPVSTARITAYRELAHTPFDGDDGLVPWCAIFVNAALESSGFRGSRSGLARSFARHPEFVRLQGRAPGGIGVFWRQARGSGLGHVGFYVGESDARMRILGGNQNDAVSLAWFPKVSPTFGLAGLFWPRSAPLPELGPVRLDDAGAPLETSAA